jgi:CheY-like chemotaxis protein
LYLNHHLPLVYKLNAVKNGEEAIKVLKGEDYGSSQTLPDVLLVDINMPRMNGLEFLNIVRNTEEWKNLKAYIVTTSEEKVECIRLYSKTFKAEQFIIYGRV